MEKISWTDHVGHEEMLKRVEEETNILQTIKRKKANWIGHNLRRNCLLKNVTKRKILERNEGKTRKKTHAATGRP